MKKLLLVLMAVVLFTACKKEPVEVAGGVTYYFNKYQGDKPDTGAKIYLTKINIDTLVTALSCGQTELLLSQTKEAQEATRELKGTEYYDESVYLAGEDNIKQLQLELTNIAGKYKMDKDTLALRAYLMRNRIFNDKNTVTATVDATGRYSLKIEPGKYNVIAVSNGRNDLNLLESSGSMLIETIEVKDKTGANKDFRFGL